VLTLYPIGKCLTNRLDAAALVDRLDIPLAYEEFSPLRVFSTGAHMLVALY
jgi:hypothetical protein